MEKCNRNSTFGGTLIKGIGGTQLECRPLECSVHFESGWNYTHLLRPMKLRGHTNLILLGEDFMELFDETLFDWVRGRIRIGSEWVWMAAADTDIPCKFDCDNIPISDLNNLKSIVRKYVDIFAQNPKAPKQCVGVSHEIIDWNNA